MIDRSAKTRITCFAVVLALLGACAQRPQLPGESTYIPRSDALPTGPLTIADLKAGTAKDTTAVTFMSIGTGLCVLISCPNNTKILNDCGSKATIKDAVLIAYAKKLFNDVVGAKDKLYVMVSHSDGDHYNQVPTFVHGHSVEGVILGETRGKYKTFFQDWLNTINKNDGSPTPVIDGLTTDYHDKSPNTDLACGAGGSDGMYILTANSGTSKNDSSIVSKLQFNTFSAIFMGDAELKSVASLFFNYSNSLPMLVSNVLSSAHHGSASNGANAPSWAMVNQPNAVVFSAGESYENYGHPRCISEDVYLLAPKHRVLGTGVTPHQFTCYVGPKNSTTKTTGAAFFNTRDSGAIVFIADGTSWGIWTCPTNILQQCTKAL